MNERCGPYQLVKVLGEGSQGSVYLAHDERDGQPVALKQVPLLLEGVPDDTLRGRFLAEAFNARKLVHPNIAAVIAAGEEHGIGWVAMELAPGVPLSRYTRRERLLPDPLVLSAAAQVAQALAHAHGLGIVHRDVKPGNVMVHWPGRSLKLTDFGLARGADAEATRTGVVLGTPAYLAPEQLAGARPDARTDLYALGVLLFELFSGRRPFESTTMGLLLREVAQNPAPDLRNLAPAVSPDVAALVARLLRKRAAERPQSAAEVAAQLEAWATASAAAVPSSRAPGASG